MLSYRLRRCFPVLLLLAGLMLPLTRASAFSFSSPPIHQSSIGSAVWAWLVHLFHATWEKNGMTIDPNGQPAWEKNGMAIDPNGQPAANGDTGSQPDPHG